MPILQGQKVLLLVDGKNSYIVEIQPGKSLHTNKGIIQMDQILGKEYGYSDTTHTGIPYIVLEPTLEDIIMSLTRKTQIIYPKDIAIMLMKTGVKPGMKVLEIGTGSGALTIAISHILGKTGKIISYDLREDHKTQALKNLEMASCEQNYEIRLKLPGKPIEEKNFDVVFIDVPEPWTVIPEITPCLKPGGRIASLSPTYNQVELTGIALEEYGYVMIETIELLLRRILPRKGRTRPHQLMIGHTAFLTFARKGRN
jgi:tRNA (adenine57-N1/adenine58-N1)-methyltransferase